MTENNYPDGTIAIATVRGVPNVRVMRIVDGVWVSGVVCEGRCHHASDTVEDVRPLVVLDLEDGEATLEALRGLRASARGDAWHRLTEVADQIEAQAPHISEPGWGEKVTAHTEGGPRGVWLRGIAKGRSGFHWTNGHGVWCAWSELIDPEPVREGIES